MPAPDTGVNKPPEGARAIVESLGLDAGALGDGDLSALTLPHNSDHYSTTELETLANIQAELAELNSSHLEEVRLNPTVDGSLGEVLEVGCDDLGGDTIESVVTVVRKDYKNETTPESILPEVVEETMLVSEEMGVKGIALSSPSPDITNTVQASSSSKQVVSSCSNTTLTSKSTSSSIVVIQSPVVSSASLTNTSSGTTHVTVSGGQIFSKIPGIPGSVAISAVPQFQPLNQTLVTAKSADGKNIVQLRPARPISTSAASSSTTPNLHGIKPLQGSIKRPATNEAGGPSSRNVFAKVIITGNHQNQQPLLLTSEAGDTFTSGQPIKIISGNASHSNVSILSSPPKAISLSQAQQMGLLSPGKLQQIIPSSPLKQNIIVNKLVTSPVKSPTKITVVPASSIVKPPTKILPAPSNAKPETPAATDTVAKPCVSPQKVIIRQVKTDSQTSVDITSANSTVKPVISPQKVIIQQGSSLKPGTLLTSTSGTGQVIRIPATQNVVASSGNIAQLQVPASRPLQYVRLVSTPSTVSGVGKPLPSMATLNSNIGKQGLAAAMRTTQQTPIRMVPIAPANPSAIRNIVPKSVGAQGQRIIIPTATPITQIRGASNVTLSASAVNQISSGATLLQSGGNSYFMVTTQLVQNEQAQVQQQQSVLNTSSNNTQASNSNTSPAEAANQSKGGNAAPRTTLEPNGIRPRKPCNCTKSQCLKLYCDCFANGEFCHMCNCNNCFNNLEHEEDRQKAIRSCLDRNPQAFRPKIGKGIVGDERRHNKGCNCKRSGCLKNYCECYEAKIPCSNNCKCVGCRNIEDSSDKKSLRDLADAAEVRVQQQTAVKNKVSQQVQDIAFRPVTQPGISTRQPNTFMSDEVVDATLLCLLAQAEQAEKDEVSEADCEQSVLEEFGRCLVQIIACSTKAEGMKENPS